jgi:hypothetical protein
MQSNLGSRLMSYDSWLRLKLLSQLQKRREGALYSEFAKRQITTLPQQSPYRLWTSTLVSIPTRNNDPTVAYLVDLSLAPDKSLRLFQKNDH